jgi:hypothetical protein
LLVSRLKRSQEPFGCMQNAFPIRRTVMRS